MGLQKSEVARNNSRHLQKDWGRQEPPDRSRLKEVIGSHDVLELADNMMDEAVAEIREMVERRLHESAVDMWFPALRRMLVGLVQHLRDRAAHLRILLQVVSAYTPQPLLTEMPTHSGWQDLGLDLTGAVVGSIDALCAPPPTRLPMSSLISIGLRRRPLASTDWPC